MYPRIYLFHSFNQFFRVTPRPFAHSLHPVNDMKFLLISDQLGKDLRELWEGHVLWHPLSRSFLLFLVGYRGEVDYGICRITELHRHGDRSASCQSTGRGGDIRRAIVRINRVNQRDSGSKVA